MGRLLAVILFCAGLFCLTVPSSGFPTLADRLLAIQQSSGGGNNITFDHAATNQPATGTSSAAITFSTVGTSGLVCLFAEQNGSDFATSNTVTDTASLTWTTRAYRFGSGADTAGWFCAPYASQLSSDVITVHFTNSGNNFLELTAFAFAHVNASPFDSGGSSNVPQSGGGPTVSITTNNNFTALLGMSRNGGYAGPTDGTWTPICGSSTGCTGGPYSFSMVEYKLVTSPQPSVTVAFRWSNISS